MDKKEIQALIDTTIKTSIDTVIKGLLDKQSEEMKEFTKGLEETIKGYDEKFTAQEEFQKTTTEKYDQAISHILTNKTSTQSGNTEDKKKPQREYDVYSGTWKEVEE